ncbi:U4/U6 small nuclear ribonucleoprotein PRP3 [Acrasis kona]|uniref:U4/U6 small nuclear ribonucleoprotein PRP3 n=1 Tax=Acrasis kona TaxID=1008807 RepID=A0AAW2YZI7_9EUKA
MTDASSLAARASELQKKIHQQLKSIQDDQQQRSLSSTKVIMDEKGNLIDEHGNTIHLNKRPIATTIINKKKQNEERHQSFKFERPPDVKKNDFFDKSIGDVDQFKKKRKRGLNFHVKGTFVQEAKKIRQLQEEDQKLLEESDTQALLQQIHSTPAAASQAVVKEEEKVKAQTGEINLLYGHVDIENNPPVQIEWWDQLILEQDNYNNIDQNLKAALVDNNYIVHPVPIAPSMKVPEAGPLSLMLTAKERRKLRTQTRLLRRKEEQQQIRLGLKPEPPPKANLKNFMRVHLNDGLQDPTKLERDIRKQISQRIQNHEDRNQERKLTKQQKQKKREKKILEDQDVELQVALYRVADLSHPSNRFKVSIKATTLGITGCVITCGGQYGDINTTLSTSNNMILIIAEGGVKSTRKYKHNILERIDWNRRFVEGKEVVDEDDDEEDENFEGNAQKAALIWQGVLKERTFNSFKYQNFPDADTAKKYLKDLGLESYYNMAETWAGESEIVEEE